MIMRILQFTLLWKTLAIIIMLVHLYMALTANNLWHTAQHLTWIALMLFIIRSK